LVTEHLIKHRARGKKAHLPLLLRERCWHNRRQAEKEKRTGDGRMKKLRKIRVANGIFWVEAPDANVFVLCGCPADSAKHLMKRGLIVPTEDAGVTFETGPNAILLSDVMLQNGEFANMPEFPVLQMLYRQGMILPGHPNNTGIKPLLMGLREQLRTQTQYIYRGNYGLVSRQELLDAGVDAEQADEMMRMKLKFAFGKIRDTRDFIDLLFVETKPEEIRGGVTVRRLRLNVFEFAYEDEAVIVDLNLAPTETYEAPYPLHFHDIERAYFSVLHAGEGDGWDANRPTMSSIIMFHGKIYLIDAGPNIVTTLVALGMGVNEIEGIFHTHSHDDHFAGLTALFRADRRIKYYATPLVRASVTKKLAALLSIDEDDFSKYFDVHDLAFDTWNNIDGLEVKPIFSPHPVETSLFVFRTLWEEGYRSYAHFADIVALDVLRSMISKKKGDGGISQAFHDRVVAQYLTPADVKKLDIGGGLIHGQAEDFRDDRSGKIILSHTAHALTDAQKEIGSGAPFGTMDVLIPSYQDYALRSAFQFLRAYFPDAPGHQLRILLNNKTATFNPESILLREDVIAEAMYLILSGNVEVIRSDLGIRRTLYPGTLVGERSGLNQRPARQTYRATSFVTTLRIPSSLYAEFVKLNNLTAEIERLRERRDLLQRTRLFGEGLSPTRQNEIAQTMVLNKFAAGQELPEDDGTVLHLVKSGTLERSIGGEVHETLGMGDFLGEDRAVFDTPGFFHTHATEPVKTYAIPGAILREIPIVRWKLFEANERRKRLILNIESGGGAALEWRDEYNINVAAMDQQHQRIFTLGGIVFDVMEQKRGRPALERALVALIAFTKTHFSEEETLLRAHGYTDFAIHHKKHEHLLDQIGDIRLHMDGPAVETADNFAEFFKGWMLNHILAEDRKYGTFLNAKGVH
jgi:hemerythrin